jgi:hypothetical protein
MDYKLLEEVALLDAKLNEIVATSLNETESQNKINMQFLAMFMYLYKRIKNDGE